MKKPPKTKDSRKAVNFDLNINAIKAAIEKGEIKFKSYTSAYGKMRHYLQKNEFEHDQGSGYVSKGSMSAMKARDIFFELGKKNPWLSSCMSKCRLTSFEYGMLSFTDLVPDIQSGAESIKQDGGLDSSPTEYSPTKDPNDNAK
jgi:virulence-associated protein VapD